MDANIAITISITAKRVARIRAIYGPCWTGAVTIENLSNDCLDVNLKDVCSIGVTVTSCKRCSYRDLAWGIV